MNLDCQFVRPQARAPRPQVRLRRPPVYREEVLYQPEPSFRRPTYWDYDDEDDIVLLERRRRPRVFIEADTWGWGPLDWLFGRW